MDSQIKEIMLTKYQQGLMEENNYDMGKYLVALNTRDDDGINYFTCYEEQMKEEKAILEALDNEMAIWEGSDNTQREQIVTEKIEGEDEGLQADIDKEKDFVRGLSKIVHQLTTAAGTGKLDETHISDTEMLTGMIEEIQVHNAAIERFSSVQYGDDYSLLYEMKLYEDNLGDDIKVSVANIEKFRKQADVMTARRTWVASAFDMKQQDVEDLIKKYST
jgi:hypothetical protein